MKTMTTMRQHCAEDVAVELRFALAAIRRAAILCRGRAIAPNVERLREAAAATLDLVEAEDLQEGRAEFTPWRLK